MSKQKKLTKQKGGNVCAGNQNDALDYYSVNMRDNIYVDTQTSNGWHNQNDPTKMYSVDLNAGVNDYMFSRTTPDNKFITTSGLDFHPRIQSFQLVGGAKSKKPKSKETKPKETKSKETKSKETKTKENKKEDLKKRLADSFMKAFAKLKNEETKKTKKTKK